MGFDIWGVTNHNEVWFFCWLCLMTNLFRVIAKFIKITSGSLQAVAKQCIKDIYKG